MCNGNVVVFIFDVTGWWVGSQGFVEQVTYLCHRRSCVAHDTIRIFSFKEYERLNKFR